MNVWDWIEFAWLIGLTILAAATTLAHNNIDRVAKKTRDRVRELERQDERTRNHLRQWAKDMN